MAKDLRTFLDDMRRLYPTEVVTVMIIDATKPLGPALLAGFEVSG